MENKVTKFKVGDVVLIRPELGDEVECEFGLNDEMIRLRGNITIITQAHSCAEEIGSTGSYYIGKDCERWLWCDNCFDLVENTSVPEDVDVVDLSELL